MPTTYLFTSQRLGFRAWRDSDMPLMAEVSADPLVMEFFPSVADASQTAGFIKRMQKMQMDRGYCYFAVDVLEGDKFIGFIGLCFQDYESPVTPSVDIGWRLSPSAWGMGYATEGAQRCIAYGFETLGLAKIIAVAPLLNIKSINVMKKAGMQLACTFEHPKLLDTPRLTTCVCYEIVKAKEAE